MIDWTTVASVFVAIGIYKSIGLLWIVIDTAFKINSNARNKK